MKNKIKTLIFDLGGVIITIDHPEAIRRFRHIGISDAERLLDPYTQTGIFGDLEHGLITDEEFRSEASLLAGRELTWDECRWAWLGYAREVPQHSLRALQQLRREGYRLVVLSNTNPYMMSWVMSPEFDGCGHPLSHYVDAVYCSYKLRLMKPQPEFFQHVLAQEHLDPHEALFVDDGPRNIAAAEALGLNTLTAVNGEDWSADLLKLLTP